MAAILNALVSALDNFTGKRIGVNGHVEYDWSNSIQEKIVQFHFQVIRTDSQGLDKLANILEHILHDLKCKTVSTSLSEKVIAKGYLSMLYKMIAHTRDIVDGKGEYSLSYMMIHVWNKFYPKLAEFAVKCFVLSDEKSVHPFGSWKDIKYLCQYIKTKTATQEELLQSNIVATCCQLVNDQLKKDLAIFEGSNDKHEISLLAKWVPREKSAFGWLFQVLAINYFSDIYATSVANPESQQKAILKCKTNYRKLLSQLNKHIDTLQIKQCGKTWSEIDFNKVTSITMSKQKKAFLNVRKNNEERYPNDEDRNICASNFSEHINFASQGKTTIKGKRLSMADFTTQALLFSDRSYEDLSESQKTEYDLLNMQWNDNSKLNGKLDKMIAMVDVSGSMRGGPMDVAIALGIRIAEKSLIGNRVMTFSAKPTWFNLEHYPDFVTKANHMRTAEWGMNTNFHAALDMILEAIVENKLSAEEVQDMVLVILSDMQIDSGDKCDKNALYEVMKQKYEEAGMKTIGRAYKPPHIVFWNLKSSNGFPTLSNQSNTSMMSGFSPSLLNTFCEQGMEALQSCTPWSQLERLLENDRYRNMQNCFNELV